MASAAEIASEARKAMSPDECGMTRGIISPGGDGADRGTVNAGVTTATDVAAGAPRYPARCDIEPDVTGTVSHRAGTETVGAAGAVGGAGRKWRWVAFGAGITAAVMDLLDSTITQ